MNTMKKIKELLVLTFGTIIVSCAVYFFLIPSETSISSISGLAIVLTHFIPLKVSTLTLIMNAVLLVISFILIGKDFGAKTVYTAILMPIVLAILEVLFPNVTSITGSDIIDVTAYCFLVSFGIAMLFNNNASSGGLDIVAKIMNKYLHMEIGKALALSGMIVSLSSALVYSPRKVILSVLGTYFCGILTDYFIFGQNIKRRVCIVSLNKNEGIKDFIINTLHSGATLYTSTGAYTKEKREEIVTIVDKREYQLLMDFIIHNDPSAFVTVYNVSNIRYVPK